MTNLSESQFEALKTWIRSEIAYVHSWSSGAPRPQQEHNSKMATQAEDNARALLVKTKG